MPNTIQIKRSGTTSQVPTSLAYGELAINYADGKLYYKNSSNNIVEFTGSGSSGTVTSITAGTGLSGRNNYDFWNYSYRFYCCNLNRYSNSN